MADNAFVKIGTALLKHQVKKLVGEDAMGAIGEEFAEIGGDKLDSWLGNKSTVEAIEKAANTARDLFRGKVNDDEVEQWMVMLPIHDLPAVLSAIEELPTSPDETKLESTLRESIAQNWRKLSPEQVNNAVNSFLTCLRSALLPIEKQTLMVIGRSVLRIEDTLNRLTKLVEQLQPYSTTTLVRKFHPLDINFVEQVLPITINAKEIVTKFCDFLQPDSKVRVLFITGDAKLGKTHLVGKVFPLIGKEQYSIKYAQVDLRNKVDVIPKILFTICSQLHPEINFDNYYQKHDNLLLNEFEETKEFVSDLRKATSITLLIFDQWDDANDYSQRWLREDLLQYCLSMQNIRVVVSGRTIPKVLSTIEPISRAYQLEPVLDDNEYITFCRKLGIDSVDLSDTTIKELARYVDYKPGFFAEFVKTGI